MEGEDDLGAWRPDGDGALPTMTEAEFDELFGGDLDELGAQLLQGGGLGGDEAWGALGGSRDGWGGPPPGRAVDASLHHTLRGLIAQATASPNLPDVVAPPSQPVQWTGSASFLSGAHSGAAPPRKRPGSGDAAAAPAPPPLDAAAADAKARRQARVAQRKEKAAAATSNGNGLKMPIGLGPGSGVPPAHASAAPGDTYHMASVGNGAASAAAATIASLQGRVDSLEKELRSALMRLQFMNKQHSSQSLKIDSLEARNAALEKEVGRLRALWTSAQVFLDQGAGI